MTYFDNSYASGKDDQDNLTDRIHTGRKKIASPRHRVEVILLGTEHRSLIVKSDERSRPIKIGGDGIKIISRKGPIAILDMTERQAIQYNLV